MARGTRFGILGVAAGATLLGVLLVGAVPQPPEYHDFADARTLFGIPYFWNVATNLAFVAAGLRGWAALRRSSFEPGADRRPWAAFFTAVLLASVGSAYYHWAPGNATLFWDRLPMTVIFSSILAAAVGDGIGGGAARRLFLPFLAAATASLVYAGPGGGDVRFYGLLQAWAMAGVPIVLLLFPPRYTHASRWTLAVALYGAAKLLELGDRAVMDATGFTSGHPLKHLAAAAAAWVLAGMLARREPKPAGAALTGPLPDLQRT